MLSWCERVYKVNQTLQLLDTYNPTHKPCLSTSWSLENYTSYSPLNCSSPLSMSSTVSSVISSPSVYQDLSFSPITPFSSELLSVLPCFSTRSFSVWANEKNDSSPLIEIQKMESRPTTTMINITSCPSSVFNDLAWIHSMIYKVDIKSHPNNNNIVVVSDPVEQINFFTLPLFSFGLSLNETSCSSQIWDPKIYKELYRCNHHHRSFHNSNLYKSVFPYRLKDIELVDLIDGFKEENRPCHFFKYFLSHLSFPLPETNDHHQNQSCYHLSSIFIPILLDEPVQEMVLLVMDPKYQIVCLFHHYKKIPSSQADQFEEKLKEWLRQYNHQQHSCWQLKSVSLNHNRPSIFFNLFHLAIIMYMITFLLYHPSLCDIDSFRNTEWHRFKNNCVLDRSLEENKSALDILSNYITEQENFEALEIRNHFIQHHSSLEHILRTKKKRTRQEESSSTTSSQRNPAPITTKTLITRSSSAQQDKKIKLQQLLAPINQRSYSLCSIIR